MTESGGGPGSGLGPERGHPRERKIRLGTSVDDLSIGEQIALADSHVRRRIAYSIMGLFAAVNLATLVFVYLLFCADQGELARKLIGPGDRVVNASVVMTLLGATTVQLGSAMLIMARFVFRPVDRGGLRAE